MTTQTIKDIQTVDSLCPPNKGILASSGDNSGDMCTKRHKSHVLQVFFR